MRRISQGFVWEGSRCQRPTLTVWDQIVDVMRAQKYDLDVYIDMIWASYISIAFGVGMWDGMRMKCTRLWSK